MLNAAWELLHRKHASAVRSGSWASLLGPGLPRMAAPAEESWVAEERERHAQDAQGSFARACAASGVPLRPANEDMGPPSACGIPNPTPALRASMRSRRFSQPVISRRSALFWPRRFSRVSAD